MNFTIYSRRYAPFEEFGFGFKGDRRLYTSRLDVTSKTSASVYVSYAGGKFSVEEPQKKASLSSHSLSKGSRGTAFSKVQPVMQNEEYGVDKASFTLYTKGNLPLFSMIKSYHSKLGKSLKSSGGLDSAIPEIDTYLDVDLSIKDEKIQISVVMRGDSFPNAEAFIICDSGSEVGLINYTVKNGSLNRQFGPYSRLFFTGKGSVIAKHSKNLSFSANGLENSPTPKNFQDTKRL